MRLIPDDISIETGELRLTEDYSIYGDYYHTADTVEISDDVDWTLDKSTLRSNSSELFNVLCKEVESVIRGDAFALIGGRADLTARLVVAQLAHKHKLIPMRYLQEIAENKNDYKI